MNTRQRLQRGDNFLAIADGAGDSLYLEKQARGNLWRHIFTHYCDEISAEVECAIALKRLRKYLRCASEMRGARCGLRTSKRNNNLPNFTTEEV